MNTIPRRTILGVFLATLTMALAGCTGDFQINQTEPFRVAVDDEDAETVQVAEDDDEPNRLVIDNPEKAEVVDIIVVVEPADNDDDTIILIQIADEDDEQTFIVEKEITIRGAGGGDDEEEDDNETDGGNETGGETGGAGGETTEAGQQVTLEDVDIRGNNIVVITQAIQGEADVDVNAKSTGGGSQGDTQETGDDNNTTGDSRRETPGSAY